MLGTTDASLACRRGGGSLVHPLSMTAVEVVVLPVLSLAYALAFRAVRFRLCRPIMPMAVMQVWGMWMGVRQGLVKV